MEDSSEQLSHQYLKEKVSSLLPDPIKNQTTDQVIVSTLSQRLKTIYQINEQGSSSVKIPERVAAEWALASILTKSSVEPDRLNPLDSEKLRQNGFDQARLARLIVLEMAYPKGIEYNAPTILLELDRPKMDFLKQILTLVPGYRENAQSVLDKLMSELGINKNPNADNYIRKLSGEEFFEIIRKISFTSGSTPSR